MTKEQLRNEANTARKAVIDLIAAIYKFSIGEISQSELYAFPEKILTPDYIQMLKHKIVYKDFEDIENMKFDDYPEDATTTLDVKGG